MAGLQKDGNNLILLDGASKAQASAIRVYDVACRAASLQITDGVAEDGMAEHQLDDTDDGVIPDDLFHCHVQTLGAP